MPTEYSFPKSKIRVLLLEGCHQSAVDLFVAEGYKVETCAKALSEDELSKRIRGVHVLGIRSKTRVTEAVLANADRLLAIGCFCIGTDQVDLTTAEAQGVAVFNAPFSNTRSVAELVLAEIIALSRTIMDKSSDLHKGIWSKSAAGAFEVRGKKLGIVGFGHIGSQLSIIAEALGMEVLFYDSVAVLPIGRAVATDSLEKLLAQSDFVSLHVPRSPATANMISTNELALMKPGAKLINASRGSVVDIDALATAITSGHIGGAAVDVFPTEPAKNGPGFESPLCGLPNVILTPHIGGSTAEAQINIGREVATALTNYVNIGSTTGAVNFPRLEMPFSPNSHRILNLHKNVPGVLRDINHIISECGANVAAQVLGTSTQVGYIIIDVDKEAGLETKMALADLAMSISTRILY
jgi:D-3-phosphoglycerate dehydrogenase / 2-oxoglutarate reductase